MQVTVQMHPPRERKPGELPPEPRESLLPKVWQKVALRPEEGWTTFILLAGVIYSAVWSIQVVNWVNGLGVLTWTTAAGLVLGFIAAKQRFVPRLLVHGVMMVAGVYFAFWQVAATVYGGSQGGLWVHATTWLRKAITPNADTNDDVMFLLFLGVLSFILAYVSVWLVARTRRPWLVTLATAIVLLINLSYAPDGNLIYLTIFLLSGLLLLVRFNLSEAYRQWRRRSLRYTADLGWDFMVAGMLFSVGILVLGWLLPPAGTNPALSSVWNSSSNPWSAVQQLFTRLFQVNNGSGYGAYFSNRLQLTGSVDLPNFTVLTYTTQAPGQYLIAVTQDYFDGHAWTSTNSTTKAFDAGQHLDDPSVDVKTIEQTIHLVNPPAGNPSQYLFAAAQPVSFSVPSSATQDASGYTSWYVRGQLTSGEQYTALSDISTASENTLRQVPFPQKAENSSNPLYYFPKDVLDRYLQIPSDLKGQAAGEQIYNLAMQWTQDDTTMYDVAMSLENHLHTDYTYSQHNPDPPADQDAVAWFLLNSKTGFCTYFASAMVIMARMLGIPARVASGYTNGSVQGHSSTWEVKGTDAHTWAQLYFAGYGWINFEPSAGFSDFVRPVDTATPTGTDTPNGGDTPPPTKVRTPEPGGGPIPGSTTPTPTPQNDQQVRLLLGVGGLLAVLLLLFGATSIWWRRLFRGLSPVAQTFGRVTLLAGWAGIKPKRTQTPFEYIETLQERFPGQAAPLQRLGELYVHERWGATGTGAGVREELRQLWIRLRSGLVRAVIHRPSLNPLAWFQRGTPRGRRGRR